MRPNIGIEAVYRRKLNALVEEMSASVEYFLSAAYRANEPVIARDDTPANALRASIRKLAARWIKRFNRAAPKLAEWFAQSVADRSQAALRSILKDAGFTVEFKMTAAHRDVMTAVVHENVNLIKSIPAQYLSRVETMVMQSVQAGRKLDVLSKDLQHQFGVTKRRAALIARSQNNMATASLTRVRQLDAGIEEAVWMHSHAGKEPRKSHLAAGARKQVYDVRTGWFDPDEKRFVLPGQLPNCRCTSRPVIKGLMATHGNSQ